MKLLHEGKSKQIFETADPNVYLMRFKDDATAGNGEKKGRFDNKGYLNSIISAKLLSEVDVDTHFIEQVNETDHLVKNVNIFPVEVIFRNIAAGSFIKRLPMFSEGQSLRQNGLPLLEFCYKSDEYGDPFIAERHILQFGWMTRAELDLAIHASNIVVKQLHDIFSPHGIEVVDGKFEFGRTSTGQFVLADEITPDGLRLWRIDEDTGDYQSLDKDLFRKGLGGETAAYTEIAHILGLL